MQPRSCVPLALIAGLLLLLLTPCTAVSSEPQAVRICEPGELAENGCISAQPYEDAPPANANTMSAPPTDTSAKRSWPELVGVLPGPASDVIKAERPDLKVQVLPAGTMATMEFNDGRVRLWLGADGKISQTPSIG